MIRTSYKKNQVCYIVLFVMSLIWSNSSVAALVNGDFSAGFNDWQGSTSLNGVVVPSAYPDNFSILSSGLGAKLSTNRSARNVGNKLVELFQNFRVQNLISSSNTLSLSFGHLLLDIDHVDDIYSAHIFDINDMSHNLNLTVGNSFDITSFADKQVQLMFSIENNGSPDGSNDFLEIGNISINQTSVSIPEPNSLILMGVVLGLVLIRAKENFINN